MPLFTKAGLVKLEQLHKDVVAILESKEVKETKEERSPSSPYSKKIAKNALEIIARLKEGNDSSITKLRDIEPLIGYIDDQSFTGVPVVFNDESAKLAEAFIKFLKSLDIKNDFGITINFLIQAKGLVSKASPKEAIEQHIRETEAQLDIYKKIGLAKSAHEEVFKLQDEIANYFVMATAENTVLYKFKNNGFANYESFLQEYEEKMHDFLKQAIKLPYVALVTCFDDFINAAEPYCFNPGVFSTSSPGSTLLKKLSSCEEYVNLLLSEKNWPKVNYLPAQLAKIFTPEKVAARKTEILKLYEEFEANSKAYKTGEHLRFYQSVDSMKKELMDIVTENIQSVRGLLAKRIPDILNRTLLDVFKLIYKVASLNVEVSQKKDIGIGKCGQILRIFQLRLLELLLKGEWGNDEVQMLTYHPEISRSPVLSSSRV